jgi:anti-sigma B factor antagonist
MVMNGRSDLQGAGARASWEGVRTIVWLWGEHDLSTADRLMEFLVVAAADPGDLVVDLSAVSFMDASTISTIVRARSRMAESARRLTVRSPSTLMERVFGSCGLDGLIERAEAPRVERPERARSALESWVAVASRTPAPSDHVQPALEEAGLASRE